MSRLVLCLILCFCGSPSRAAEGAGEGPSPYDDQSPSLLETGYLQIPAHRSSGLTLALDVWYPAAPGRFPVFFFMTGLNGLAPTQAYMQMMHKLSARGVVVVAPIMGKTAMSSNAKIAAEFVRTIVWMEDHLASRVRLASAASRRTYPEPQKLVIAAHSSAVKAMMALYRLIHAEVKGLVLMEPVNSDPMGMTEPAIRADEYLDHGTPTLFLATGLGNQPGRQLGRLWPACAPDASAAPFFYQHFAGPKWFVKTLDYGHADMLEGVYLKSVQATRFCLSAAHLDPSPFRSFLAGAIATFVKIAAEDRRDLRHFLEVPGAIPLRSAVMFELPEGWVNPES